MTNNHSHSPAPIALILGAAGFIGRNLCRKMAGQGFVVYGIGHGQLSEANRLEYRISRWLQADITLENLCASFTTSAPTVVVHCCGSGAVSHSYADPVSDFDRSVTTVQAMLEFCRRQPTPPRAVLASSAAVYGDQGDVDIAEDATLNPVSPYGYHKVMAEQLCEYYSRFFEIDTRAVRLFSVYGEGLRKQLLWDALNKLEQGNYSFFGTGAEIRDWIHVDDAVRLIAAAAISERPTPLFLNGGNVKASTKEVLALLARAVDSTLLPEFSGVEHAGNPRRLTADNSQAMAHLGFSGTVTLQAGLERYATWFAATRAGGQ